MGNMFDEYDKNYEKLERSKQDIDNFINSLTSVEKRILKYIYNYFEIGKEFETKIFREFIRENFKVIRENFKPVKLDNKKIVSKYIKTMYELINKGLIKRNVIILENNVWKDLEYTKEQLDQLFSKQTTPEKILEGKERSIKTELTWVGQRIAMWMEGIDTLQLIGLDEICSEEE